MIWVLGSINLGIQSRTKYLTEIEKPIKIGWGNLHAQKFVKTQISLQELLRKMLISSQIFFIPVLVIEFFFSLNFRLSLTWQVSFLSLKRVTVILRKTIDQSTFFHTSQKSLNDACFVKFLVLWIPI